MAIQGLRPHFAAGGVGSIPGLGTKIPHTVWCGQKKKKKKENQKKKYKKYEKIFLQKRDVNDH